MEPQNQHKNWIGRNWKWALPAGGCLIVLVLIIVFVVSLVTGVSSLFKNSEPYQYALEQANQSEWVDANLGVPLEVDGIASGNINLSDDNSSADLSIPVKGTKAEGDILVIAEKTGDSWEYLKMEVSVDGSEETHSLLDNPALTPEEN